jgi:hypothetical protein
MKSMASVTSASPNSVALGRSVGKVVGKVAAAGAAGDLKPGEACYAPGMTNQQRDPAATVRRAWSMLRLTALQAIVNETIVGLQRLEPSELLGRPLSGLDQQLESNPIVAALEACSEELREESGMTDSHESRLLQSRRVRASMLEQPVAWTATFQEAFEKYRLAAGRALDQSLKS